MQVTMSGAHSGWRAIFRKALDFSPKRLLQGARIAYHFRSHRKFQKQISKSCFREIVKKHPAIRFKFIGNYLAKSFSTENRLRILANHYDFFQKRFADSSNRLFPDQGLQVWSRCVGDDSFSIHMTLPGAMMMEGELCLVFRMNARTLFTMTFAIVSGDSLGLDAHQAIFIGGSQGSRGHSDSLRHAAKAIGEICPATMLLIAAQAMGRALGIGTVIGVASREHSSSGINACPADFLSAYDTFWITNGGEPWGNAFRMRAAISDKPSTSASSSHRARARRKRARKQELLEEMQVGFEKHFHLPNRKTHAPMRRPMQVFPSQAEELTLHATRRGSARFSIHQPGGN
ncbi:MAG: hypothetical protein JWP91_2377 [Fibrobacteres bacterium]|nr:hypothetical protein [Fibrobacterota bacterium]